MLNTKDRTYQLALKVIRLIDRMPYSSSGKVITDQLLRSATSIGANITEAKGSSSRKDYTNFFYHALKSANETKYWLELLRDTNKAELQTLNILIKETEEITKIIASSIITLKNRNRF